MPKILVLVLLMVLSRETVCIQLEDLSNSQHSEAIINEFESEIKQYKKIVKQPLNNIPVYSVYLSDSPKDRFKQITKDKKQLLNQFIDHLYQIPRFKYSMWIAKFIFMTIPSKSIMNYLGQQYYQECQGIARQSGRQLYQIVVYNHMYQIGAAQDFCTSIALTQYQSYNNQDQTNKSSEKSKSENQKQNLSILARNLDYGFQYYLVKNTVQINFYSNKTTQKPSFTIVTHAGFVSSHTVLKYQNQNNLQFGLTLNQRKSQTILSTWSRVIFTGCQSVFQLTNRLLTTNINKIQDLINLVSNSNSCSKFYFIIQSRDGDHVLIQKNEGVGAHRVYFEKAVDTDDNPFFIVQTNTDQQKKDPDGRRVQAIRKINYTINSKGFVNRQDLKRVLFQAPNFNDRTLMTALIDVQKGQIQTIMWSNQTKL